MIDKWGDDTSPAASLLPTEAQITTTRAKRPAAQGVEHIPDAPAGLSDHDATRAKLLTMGQKPGE